MQEQNCSRSTIAPCAHPEWFVWKIFHNGQVVHERCERSVEECRKAVRYILGAKHEPDESALAA